MMTLCGFHVTAGMQALADVCVYLPIS
ncbi:MAG: hypothetical protein ACI8YD_002401, partial [Rheinheimera aquimaris]